MRLIIDTGNSYTKYAVFRNQELIHFKRTEQTDFEDIVQIDANHPGIKACILCSVKTAPADFYDLCQKRFQPFVFFDEKIRTPLINKYHTKSSLGKDRLAACVGANYLFPGTNLLVIDAGSAITFDFVSDQNEFLGGNISPGMEMRFRALNEFSGGLPRQYFNDDFGFIGKSTDKALLNGVVNGIIFEMKSYIFEFNRKFGNGKVLLTGGDSVYFANSLKNLIFADQNLTLAGLNRILEFYEQNH